MDLAADDGRPASRCEVMAALAARSAALGVEGRDAELLGLAERSANEAGRAGPHLSGHPPWAGQADAVLARSRWHAATRGGPQPTGVCAQRHSWRRRPEDPHLSILLPTARVLREVGAPEAEVALGYVGYSAAMIAQRTLDESIRIRWFGGPLGRAVTELIGASDLRIGSAAAERGRREHRVVHLLEHGRTNAEIAAELGLRRGRGRPPAGGDVRGDRCVLTSRGDRLRLSGGRPDDREDGSGPCGSASTVPAASAPARASRLAPTAFDWLAGDAPEGRPRRPDSVDEDLLREAAMACPTRRSTSRRSASCCRGSSSAATAAPRRVEKTFMFTDIVELDEPGRGARRRGLADVAGAGTTRRCASLFAAAPRRRRS